MGSIERPPTFVVASVVAVPPLSNASSVCGIVNCEKPQSKQTNSFGNNHTWFVQIFEATEMDDYLRTKFPMIARRA
jgi:hypothetical protein